MKIKILIAFGYYITRSNEILGWEGVGNRQLLCFFTASMMTANLKFRTKKNLSFFVFVMFYIKNRIT
jgi:hypothetical protein